jgi:plastocyanin
VSLHACSSILFFVSISTSDMMYSTAIIASSLLLIAGAMGQTNPAGTGSNSGPDGNMVNVQVVQVGNMNGDLKFDPEEIKAEAGSMVQFQFYPKVSDGPEPGSSDHEHVANSLIRATQ